MLDRATAMGNKVCNANDEMGQSVLDQQKWNTVWREAEQLCNNQEEIDGGCESMENSDDVGTAYQRCSYQNEEENIEDTSINNDSNMAG